MSGDAELVVGVALFAASELHIYQQFDVGDTLGAGGKKADCMRVLHRSICPSEALISAV